MQEKKFNDIIVELRREQGMTQQDLANKLNITDKAVSKWERGLSYPDITSISSLANALGVESSYLIDLCKKEDSINPYARKESIKQIISLICNGVGIAMGVAVVTLNILDQIEVKDALSMLGIGLFCISLSALSKTNDNEQKLTRKKQVMLINNSYIVKQVIYTCFFNTRLVILCYTSNI